MRCISMSKRDKKKLFFLVFGTLAAGVVNGLLGTGGGTVLVPVLAYAVSGYDTEDCLISAMITVLFLSAISFFTYGAPKSGDVSSLLYIGIPAAAGGVLGAVIGERMKPKILSAVFAVLIIWSGIKMIV